MRFLFIFILIVANSMHADIELKSLPTKVHVGQKIAIEFEISIPNDARGAFEVYLNFMKATSPLPSSFFLEDFSIEANTVLLFARILSFGRVEIPLGLFYWEDKAYAFPKIVLESVPLHVPHITLEQMRIPFPEKVFKETKENAKLQSLLRKSNLENALGTLSRKIYIQWFVFLIAFVAVFFPFLLQYNRREKKSSIGKEVPIVTPQQRFFDMKQLCAQDQEAWSDLLFLLNHIEHQHALTAHELGRYCEKRGNLRVREICLLVEQYAYRPGRHTDLFQRALASLEKELFC